MDERGTATVPRTLVFVAGGGELAQELAAALDPAQRAGIHFLYFVDGTASGAQPAANASPATHPANITALSLPIPLGPGGRQKLACRLAVDEAFSCVALYGSTAADASLLSQLIGLAAEGTADVAVAGGEERSRPLSRLVERLGGLDPGVAAAPLRVFSVPFLERVPFEANSDEAHFGTELLLQAHHLGARIERLPGAGVAGVGRRSLLAALGYTAHRVGMLCSLKFRHLRTERYGDKTTMLYSSHTLALDIVRQHRPSRILDVGCGAGFVAHACEQMGSEVTGVDAVLPRDGMMSRFFQLDLESDQLPVDPYDYDLVLLLDVIEHLEDPEGFLLALRQRGRSLAIDRPPLVVVSTPNVAFAAIRLNLLLGRFAYAERGILDITHKRLFTRSSVRRSLLECGYLIESIRPVPVPFGTVVGGAVGRILEHLAAALAWLSPTLFGFQLMVTCRPRPNAGQILDWNSARDDRTGTAEGAPRRPGPAS